MNNSYFNPMKSHISLILLLLLLHCGAFRAQVSYASYVNPFIGTGGAGHTFPGAVMPFGMVQLSPDTRIDGSWEGCSGYHYSDKVIYGFSHTHLSGTGCSDWGDVLLMPTVGAPSMDNKEYSSTFDHKNEKAGAGFYEVVLDDHAIKAELTVTPRTGIHRYSFPKTKEANILLDLLHRDKTIDCNVTVRDSVTVTGFRSSEAWAKKQTVYFAIRFSRPFKKAELASGKKLISGLSRTAGRIEGAAFRFDQDHKQPLLVKVAISSTGTDGALKNLEAEAPHWDFERYKSDAEAAWNKQLQKITVEDPDKDKLTTFYTALYHCSIHPSLYMDVDHRYTGRDGQVHTAQGFTNYSVFSLWDTYRALNPLFTLIDRPRVRDLIHTFLAQYQQSGRLPMWELSANETDCMIGFHSVSVIADAMVKGIRGFDTTLAYAAMKAASEYTAYSIPEFNKKGFLQVDDENESVSKSLEYAYDNWCLAQMAMLMKQPADAQLYLQRSQAYKNVFDATTGFMRPRKNGGWLTPFRPSEINNHFTEGNSWQYSFYVPHDLEGLIRLHGGRQHFERKLDELFSTGEKTSGRNQADVTGLIGQYAHGNEPSHHIAYLYNYAGQPQKTIARTQQICREFYRNAPDGLIGNEDCGQMSAWYIFSAMGLYPVCPGSPYYNFSEPIFSTVTIRPEEGSPLQITAANPGRQQVAGVSLNSSMSLNSFITHAELVNGGKLEFLYAPAGKENHYGKDKASIAPSVNGGADILPVPIIAAPSRVFKNSMSVSITPINSGPVNCVYAMGSQEPSAYSPVYEQPIELLASNKVSAKAISGDQQSKTAEAVFYKLRFDYEVSLHSKPDAQYSADGAQSLVDGISGDLEWRKGDWLGFTGQDLECVLDLKQVKEIRSLALDALQDTRSWIVFPTQVIFYISDDNVSYKLVEAVKNTVPADDYKKQRFNFAGKYDVPLKARYVKVVAKNYGRLPDWHEGKGGNAYIFVDELRVW